MAAQKQLYDRLSQQGLGDFVAVSIPESIKNNATGHVEAPTLTIHQRPSWIVKLNQGLRYAGFAVVAGFLRAAPSTSRPPS